MMSQASSLRGASLHEAPAVMEASGRWQGVSVLLLIGVVAALVVMLYAESYATMAAMWHQGSHNYGLVVFPIAAFLLWRLRGTLGSVELKPWPWGLPLLAALTLAWMLGRVLGVQVVEQFAAVALIPAAVATFFGIELARRALFPLLFLLAAVPVGDALLPFLMRATADIAVGLLRTVGVPVFRQGQFMTLPGGRFEIADVCGGLRYLTSGTIVALLFGYLTYRYYAKRAVFVAIAAVSMVLLNGIRAFVVMFVASATRMRVFAGRDHVYFGWLLFAAAVVAMFWVGTRFADVPAEASTDAGAGVVHAESLRAQTFPFMLVLALVFFATTAPLWTKLGDAWFLLPPVGVLLLWSAYKVLGAETTFGAMAGAGRPYRHISAAVVICVAAALLAAGPVVIAGSPAAVPARAGTLELPAIAGCGSAGTWSENWRPKLESPDFAALGTYECAGAPVSVFVAGYDTSEQGKELVGESDQLIPYAWRRYVTTGHSRFETADGRWIVVNEVQVRKDRRGSLIWYWYAVGGHSATTSLAVKLWQGLQLLTHGRSGGTVYLLQTRLGSTPSTSRERLASPARQLAALDLAAEANRS